MGWPEAGACRRIAFVIYGLALAMHVSVGGIAVAVGLGLRGSTIVAELVALLGVALWFSRRLRLPAREAFALRGAAPVHWIIAVAAAAPLQLVGAALQRVVFDLWPVPEQRDALSRALEELVRTDSAVDWAMLLVAGVVVAAISEEVLFRGIILRLLVRHSGWWPAIALSGLLFAAFHLDPIGLLPRALVGIWLAVLVWRSGSICPAIAAHAVNNLIGLVGLSLAGDAVIADVPGATAVPAVAAIVFTALLAVYLRATRQSGDANLL